MRKAISCSVAAVSLVGAALAFATAAPASETHDELRRPTMHHSVDQIEGYAANEGRYVLVANHWWQDNPNGGPRVRDQGDYRSRSY